MVIIVLLLELILLLKAMEVQLVVLHRMQKDKTILLLECIHM